MISPIEISLIFSEPVILDELVAQVDNNRISATITRKTDSQYVLNLPFSLTPEINFLMEISGVTDMAGNYIEPSMDTLIYQPFYIRKAELVSKNTFVIEGSKTLDYFAGEVFVNNFSVGAETNIAGKVLTIMVDSLPQDTCFEVRLTQIISEMGDTIPAFSDTFLYHFPQPFDLVVTEIMFDPTPVVALAESEYVEIFNRSGFTLFMDDVQLMVGDKYYNLPAFTLPPQEYLLLHDNGDESVYSVNNIYLSGLALPNSGTSIRLSSRESVICQANYSFSLHSGSFKSDGGWSLERLDLDNPEDIANWVSSTDKHGGSPGVENSTYAIVDNQATPQVTGLYVTDSNSVIVYFSELINNDKPGQIIIDNKLVGGYSNFNWSKSLEVSSVKIDTTDLSNISVEGYTDLYGAVMQPYANAVSKPVKAKVGDIVINEILFNSSNDGVEYVELMNLSQRCVDLSDVSITKPTLDDSPGKAYKLSGLPIMLQANSYAVVCSDTAILSNNYVIADEVLLMEPNNFPNLPNDASSLMLINYSGNIIDSVAYNESFHYDLLSEVTGVALERINPLLPAVSSVNWHSASALSGYATPGERNSQQTYDSKTEISKVNLSSEVISPNNDGIDDYLTLNFGNNLSGDFCTIKIVDSNGILVRRLIENTLIGAGEQITWKGDDDKGKRLHTGIYLIMIEYWKSGEAAFIERLPVVISS